MTITKNHKILGTVLLVLLLVGIANAVTLPINASYGITLSNNVKSNWTAFRDAQVGTWSYSDYIRSQMTANNATLRYSILMRGGVTWDTSSVPDTATITSATITGYAGDYGATMGQPNFSWVDFSPTNKSSYLYTTDFNNTAFTVQSDAVPYSSMTTLNAPVVWTLNAAGLASLNKTGLTSFMLDNNWSIANTEPSAWAASQLSYAGIRSPTYSSGAYIPVLTIEYTPAGGSAPVSAFSGTPVTGTSPTLVTFTDASTNTPTAWKWYFWANETVSNTTQNPVQSFTSGSYSIRLNASNAGGSDWENKTAYIGIGGTYSNATFIDIYDGSPYRNTVDTWRGIRNGAGTGVNTGDGIGNDITTSTTSGYFLYNYRGGVTFNTSTIGTTSTINSATLTGYVNSKYNDYGTQPTYSWIDFSPASKISYVAADYSETTFTRMTDSLPYASFGSANTPVTWNLTAAGISNISKTGLTSFMWETNWTIDNTSPVWASTLENWNGIHGVRYMDGIYAPYLSVNYSATTSGIPQAVFTSNVTTGDVPFAVQFTDLSTNNPDTWEWDYGDGTYNYVTQNPIHLYTTAGTYLVTLTASNSEGFTGTSGYIYAYDTTAAFTAAPLAGEPPLTVQFTNTSTVQNITGWDWYDNGVLFSNAQDPLVSLPLGAHTINLKVTGDITDWENKTDYVNVGYAPTAHFDMAVV
jgi:PKD repeat protein